MPGTPSSGTRSGKLRRVGRAAGATAAVAISLLTFPGAIPWMAAFWLGWHSWLVARARPGWLPLVACGFILLVKRTPWLPGVAGMLIVLFAAGLATALLGRWKASRWSRRGIWIATLIVWVAWALMLFDWHGAIRSSRQAQFDPARPVVCLGDSLTAGIAPHGSYTRDLDSLLSVPVVNLGQDGATSADALARLPAVVEARPQVVVVELGGHDYLKGHGRAPTRANLERIIETCRATGAEVVLVEMPRGLISDPFWGLERQLARRHDVELVSDTPVRKLILGSPYTPLGLRPAWRLSDDGLHPNARGNRVLAEAVAEAVVRVLGTDSKQ
jgi:lysophospholipase L1-like esterase